MPQAIIRTKIYKSKNPTKILTRQTIYKLKRYKPDRTQRYSKNNSYENNDSINLTKNQKFKIKKYFDH